MKIFLTKCLPYRPSSMDSKAVEVPLAEGSGNLHSLRVLCALVLVDARLSSRITNLGSRVPSCLLCIFLVQWNMIEEEKIGMKEKEERINREKKKKMKNDVC